MESPPSSSAWSETAFITGVHPKRRQRPPPAASSAYSSASGDGRHRPLLEDSDCDDKSLSQDSSSLGSYDLFNTLKKAPPTCTSPIEPPPEFQDRRPELEHFSSHLAAQIMRGALRQCERPPLRPLLRPPLLAPEFVPFSPPCHRPASRCSLGGASSRLSSSHNSLSVPAAHRVDDSSFITQAVSDEEENSNAAPRFYCSNSTDDKLKLTIKKVVDHKSLDSVNLPTAVPDSYDFDKSVTNDVSSKIELPDKDESDDEVRLPLKKRKLSSAKQEEEDLDEQQKLELEKELLQRPKEEEISYPATPMISIAKVEALRPRPFKTPAERKEMPPLPRFFYYPNPADAEPPGAVITDQFNINNHTYNNPTINYHMSNVPVPFINIPCGSYYSMPPILLPFNNVSNFKQLPQQQPPVLRDQARKENRKSRRRRHTLA